MGESEALLHPQREPEGEHVCPLRSADPETARILGYSETRASCPKCGAVMVREKGNGYWPYTRYHCIKCEFERYECPVCGKEIEFKSEEPDPDGYGVYKNHWCQKCRVAWVSNEVTGLFAIHLDACEVMDAATAITINDGRQQDREDYPSVPFYPSGPAQQLESGSLQAPRRAAYRFGPRQRASQLHDTSDLIVVCDSKAKLRKLGWALGRPMG